jgi:pimeloyl-ACP methyl ester carboxylesterase
MPQIEVDDRQIFYRSHGAASAKPDRAPLILVHGAGGTLMNWPPNIRRLPETLIYAVDLPGHGKSSGPVLQSIPGYLDALVKFAEALDLSRFVLAGHSMGGAIAIEMAMQAPARLAGMVVIGAGSRLSVRPSILAGLRDQYEKTCTWLVKQLFGPEADRRLPIGYLRYLSLLDRELLYSDFLACDAFDRSEQVSSIDVPTLIVCGADDRMTPPDASRFLHKQIAGSQIELIDNAGHMVMLEKPGVVAATIDGFLQKC